MRPFPQEAKVLIDEIVKEIRNVRVQREDLLSIERAFSFRNRLLSFQTAAANLSNGCEQFIQTFLVALEAEINKLFEKLHSSAEPVPIALTQPTSQAAPKTSDTNVIELYPHAAIETQPQVTSAERLTVAPCNAKKEASPSTAALPPHTPSNPTPQKHALNTLALVADYLDVLIERNKAVDIQKLRSINDEIRQIHQILSLEEAPV